jgi:hypothetical protein
MPSDITENGNAEGQPTAYVAWQNFCGIAALTTHGPAGGRHAPDPPGRAIR